MPDGDDYRSVESLYFPRHLPITTSLELANHPIMEGVKASLFPNMPTGHHLVAVKDRLEVVLSGGQLLRERSTLTGDGRVATVIVTLPVRFRGGALVARDVDGREEKFFGRGGKAGDIEWTAFLGASEYYVELVSMGCRVMQSYAVHMKSFGPSGLSPEPLISPSDALLDVVAPILNYSKGKKIAFYLQHDHGVNPAEVLAETLVPLVCVVINAPWNKR